MEIKRHIFNDLEEQIENQKVSILIGPRQVGKTHLMRELEKVCRKRGMTCRYFDLEQPDDLLALGQSEKDQFDTLTRSGDVIFVDEFHLLKNISKLFKAIHDSKKYNIKIFASGSSALSMHKHLKESMAGRVIFNRIFSLTLKERQQETSYQDESILITGGLPGLIQCKNIEEEIALLQSLTATYIQKDIKALIKEENIRAFNHLLVLLAQHQGSVVVSANLSKEIGLSKPSVERYLEILSQTYVCHALPSFAKNLTNELKKSKKYFLYDLGIRNSIIKNFSDLENRNDSGVLKESFVYLSILKQLKANMEVRFWRTKNGDEIDFVLLKNQIPFPVEVKSKLNQPEIPGAIQKFLKHYPEAPGAIIFNDDINDEIETSGKPVTFMSWQMAEKIPFLQSVV